MAAMAWISLEQGFIFGLLAIGVMITFRILDLADLSVEGTFPLGAFVFARFTKDLGAFGASGLSFLAGVMAGYFTYVLYKKLHIAPILAGILTMTILYTANLRLNGQSNIPLVNASTVFSSVDSKWGQMLLLAAFALVAKGLLDWFLKTEKGYLLLVTGDNTDLVKSLGHSPNRYYRLGLCLSNGLAALAGSLTAQHQGYVDITMGQSMIVTALASIILGEAFLQKFPLKRTSRCLLGAIIYRMIYGLALYMGLAPDDLKAITGFLVIGILAYNYVGSGFMQRQRGGHRVRNKKFIQDL